MMYLAKNVLMYRFVTFILILSMTLSCSKEETKLVVAGSGSSTPKVRVVNDVLEDKAIVVAGSKQFDFLVAYESTLEDGTSLTFYEIPTLLPIIMEDQEGNRWDMFGFAVSGPRKGERLKAVTAYTSYWFAISGMYPGTVIFEGTAFTDEFQMPSPSPEWTVPSDEIFRGSAFDAIPALDYPKIEVYKEKEFWDNEYYLADTAILYGIKVAGKYRLYPQAIFDFHEIINDSIGGEYLTISYCPLTGSPSAWKSEVEEIRLTYGVSGLLYNSNLIMFDRLTESLWSQLRNECINGVFLGHKMEMIPVVETSWKTWKSILREPEVVSFDTGFSYNYDSTPFCNYACSSEASPYPVNSMIGGCHQKKRYSG